jgi:2-polyprenyl-6-methoxyphenol hydroxylase-like FAD-dependent oxidoreductase
MDVLISGAGIAGPALAWWLARSGARPVVVERAPAPRSGGHAVDIRGAAVDVVTQMGLLEPIRAARTRLGTLSIVRGPGEPTIDIDIPRALPERSRDVEIVRDDLARILYEATRDDADYRFGDAISAIAGEGPRVRVTFRSGATGMFDLVVGADGQHSVTRELIFGPESTYSRSIGAYLAIFGLPNLLGLTDRAMLYNEPGRAVAYYTMVGNERAKALFIYRSGSERVDASQLRDERELRALLRRRFERVGWETKRLLDAMDATTDFYFDEIAQIHMPRWWRGRVVLIGDAAHGPSPLSGQGTTLALVGARVLADALSAHAEPSGAFEAYERRMRAYVRQNQDIAQAGLRMLLPGSRAAIAVRNAAMRVFPLLLRLGVGFGKKLERASNAIELPPAGSPGRAPAVPGRDLIA